METRGRLQTPDALRGIAAFSVMVFHFAEGARWAYWGHLGLYAFFVLSGFILPWTMHRARFRPGDAPVFLAKRCLRIWPLYFISVFWVAAFSGAWKAETFFVHAFWLNGIFGRPWLLEIYWTLALEAQWYLVLVLLLPALAHDRAWVRRVAYAIWCVSGLALPQSAWVFQCSGFFSVGIAVWWWVSNLETRRVSILALLLASAVLAFSHGLPQVITGLVTAALLAQGQLGGVLLGWLGCISYPLYLFHLSTKAIMSALGLAWAAIPASLLVAWLMHRIVERRFFRLAAKVRYSER